MQNKSWICVLTAIMVFVFVFCGCQATPDSDVVTNKNGTFENALESAVENVKNTVEEQEHIEAADYMGSEIYTKSFTSMDGSITYEVDIACPDEVVSMDVLRVTPHTITSDEAQRIAHAIFGDVDVYEYSTEMSKAELEEKILELRQYISNWDVLVKTYGGDEILAAWVQKNYEGRIADLEELYAEASDSVESKVCDWTFHSESYYSDPSWGISNEDEITQAIKATIWVDGTPYVYSVSNRDAEDYRIHSVYAYIDDLVVSESQKYSTQEIADDIDRMKTQAQQILDSMGMGEWVIDSATVSKRMNYDGGDSFWICTIIACPVYEGVKVTYQGQLSNLKSDDVYASNYYYENITFVFSGGRLTSFFYDSPLDVIDMTENVSLLTFDEAIGIFETQMSLNDAAYYLGATTAEVDVTDVELGFARIRVQNDETDFYLAPAYTFYGITTIYDDKGEIIEWSSDDTVTKERLLTVNAVDGTIINTVLGY